MTSLASNFCFRQNYQAGGKTRWSSRADAVNVVLKKLSEVVNALEQLTEEGGIAITRSDASLILDSVLSF